MPQKRIQRSDQFGRIRRLGLYFGFDCRQVTEAEELFLLARMLRIEARDCGVPNSDDEEAILRQARAATVEGLVRLRDKIQQEMQYRRQGLNSFVALAAAVASALSAAAAWVAASKK